MLSIKKCLPKERLKIYYLRMFLWIPNTHKKFGNNLSLRNLALLCAMNFEAILIAKDSVTTTFENKFVVNKKYLVHI